MVKPLPRLLIGALLGPLIFTALLMLLIYARYGETIFSASEEDEQILSVLIMGVLMITNLHVFLIGWPYYIYLKNRNRLRLRNLLLGGFAFASATSLLISVYLRTTNLFQLGIQMLIYGVSGLILSYLVWRIGIKE